ncbi:hypothetical protein BH11PLA2_BH11PLA2_38850 [soil metagenome]
MMTGLLPTKVIVDVVWSNGKASVAEIQKLRIALPELDALSLLDLYNAAKDRLTYRIGIVDYLKAMKISHDCRNAGIKVVLEDPDSRYPNLELAPFLSNNI